MMLCYLNIVNVWGQDDIIVKLKQLTPHLPIELPHIYMIITLKQNYSIRSCWTK